jgi:hypothetical protein
LSGITVQAFQNGLLQREVLSVPIIPTPPPGYPPGVNYILDELVAPFEIRVGQNRSWATVSPSSGVYSFAGPPSTVVADFTLHGVQGEIDVLTAPGTFVIASTSTLTNVPLSGSDHNATYASVAGENGSVSLKPAAGFSYFIYCLKSGGTEPVLPPPMPQTAVLRSQEVLNVGCP